MDDFVIVTRIPRIDQRYRRRANIQIPKKQPVEAEVEVGAQEEVDHLDAIEDQLATQEEIDSFTMGRSHKSFHRRAPQADAVTQIITVNVEVVATVDSSGNVVGQETRTQADPAQPTPAGASPAPPASVAGVAGLVASPAPAPPAAMGESLAPSPALPQVPSVPPFPTNALPTVPAVPAFPSDLRVPTVPSYPWPSGVSVVVAAATTRPPVTSPAPTSLLDSVPASAAPTPLSNSTLSSRSLSASQLTSLDSISASVLTSQSQSISQSSQTLSSESTTATSDSTSTLASSTAAGSNYFGGGGGSPNTAVPSAQPTEPVAAGSSGGSSSLPTPKVVGSVVGSLAGAALILAIVLLLLRRHKRQRRGALQLPEDEHHDAQPMTQSSPRNNRIPSAFLNRFSGLSRSTAETSTSGGERSFQRVSGRKLPSAFSEGMTSEQFSRGDTMSGSSFYQDDHGTYGGTGLSKELGKEIGVAPAAAATGTMNIRPGPARTPVVRHPDDDANPFADPAPFPRAQSHLSPPQSPQTDQRRGTLGRSLQSADGSRSSKFTENV